MPDRKPHPIAKRLGGILGIHDLTGALKRFEKFLCPFHVYLKRRSDFGGRPSFPLSRFERFGVCRHQALKAYVANTEVVCIVGKAITKDLSGQQLCSVHFCTPLRPELLEKAAILSGTQLQVRLKGIVCTLSRKTVPDTFPWRM